MDSPDKIDQLNEIRILAKYEYEDLLFNIENVNQTLVSLNREDIPAISEKLRLVEKRLGLVLTVFKTAVYNVNVSDGTKERREIEPFYYEPNSIFDDESSEFRFKFTNRPSF